MPISEEESTVLSRSFRPVSLTSFGQSIPSAACAALADGISTFTTRSASFAHAPDVPMLSRGRFRIRKIKHGKPVAWLALS